MAFQPLLFAIYIIGLYLEQQIKFHIFYMISKYFPSHRKLLSMSSCSLLTPTLWTLQYHTI